ncbi:MAG: tRNA (adenosine(37)-N6)-threonylcarbamoyltransferase complex dimerization subunit type 1 TsaB [Advenella sp.]|uniref:tRNA (adenosine(37)-N6)-threonylcarbamoyltransferase complex dimerization subunit type 1 TsaB n=1 Tax=unclassified Advenella TaxID=2685285 RepID=UPI001866080E|nr:tRNA (adenosine(37)-N6)-threonylcarbamoyltransferase complex dimerization subunit type 1 TsaB [Advenella sp. FME57]
MNVNLISLESSATCSSAALLRFEGGQSQTTEQVSNQANGHAEQLLPMLDHLLNSAGLDRIDISGIVFGQGPGGFTGLRIAAGMAQGLGLGLDIPVFPVSSLLAVAEAVRPVAPSTMIVSLLDARMQEVFLACFRETGDGELVQVQAPCLIAAEQVPLWLSGVSVAGGTNEAAPVVNGPLAERERDMDGQPPVILVGSGVHVCSGLAHLTGIKLIPDAEPRAAIMARIGLRAWLAGRFIAADQAAPLYVRDKVAFTIKERGQGQGGNPRAVPLSAEQITPGGEAAVSPESQARSRVIRALQQAHTIRRMTQQDIDAVVEIERRVQSHPWTEGNFFDALKAGYEAWVVCHGDEIVGFSLQLMAPDVAHLLLIGVAPDWQSKGIGAGLLAWSEERLLLQQLESQVLEVRPSNAGAIAFYHRWGYEQIGVRKGYYPDGRGHSEDAWVLQKAVVS